MSRMSLQITIWKVSPEKDVCPELPWRASTVCPFTGNLLVLPGKSGDDATERLIDHFRQWTYQHCSEPPVNRPWVIDWE